jgi:hypothetical protein
MLVRYTASEKNKIQSQTSWRREGRSTGTRGLVRYKFRLSKKSAPPEYTSIEDVDSRL